MGNPGTVREVWLRTTVSCTRYPQPQPILDKFDGIAAKPVALSKDFDSFKLKDPTAPVPILVQEHLRQVRQFAKTVNTSPDVAVKVEVCGTVLREVTKTVRAGRDIWDLTRLVWKDECRQVLASSTVPGESTVEELFRSAWMVAAILNRTESEKPAVAEEPKKPNGYSAMPTPTGGTRLREVYIPRQASEE